MSMEPDVPSGPHLLMGLPCHLKRLFNESVCFSPVNRCLFHDQTQPGMLRGSRVEENVLQPYRVS